MADAEAGPTPEQRRALFRVVRGTPDEAEIAALTAVLAAVTADRGTAAGGAGGVGRHSRPAAGPRPASTWAAPETRLRSPLTVGPDAWRTSTWPH